MRIRLASVLVVSALIGGGAEYGAIVPSASASLTARGVARALAHRESHLVAAHFTTALSFPNSAGPYADCPRWGNARRFFDRIADIRSNVAPGHVRGPAGMDITTVTLARLPTRLCVDFATRAPSPAGIVGFTFDLRSFTGGPSGALVRINFGFVRRGLAAVALGYPGSQFTPSQGIVRASVGTRGNDTSLVIDRRVLPPWTPFGGFQWDGLTIVNGAAPGVQLYDCAPDGADALFPPDAGPVQVAGCGL